MPKVLTAAWKKKKVKVVMILFRKLEVTNLVLKLSRLMVPAKDRDHSRSVILNKLNYATLAKTIQKTNPRAGNASCIV